MTVTEVHEEAQHMGIRVGDVLKGYGREWDLVGQLVVDVAFVGVCRKKYHLKCQEYFVIYLGEVFVVMSSQKSITILGLLKDDQTIRPRYSG